MSNKATKAMLIRPCYDDVTVYSFAWAGEVKNLLVDSGYLVIECALDKATESKVTELLDEHEDVKLVIFYDHGLEDQLIGQDGKAVFGLENISMLDGKIVYTVACSSSRILGSSAVAEGASCYFGYRKQFGFFSDSSEVHFQRCANIGICEILANKHSSGKIKDIIHEEYNRWIDYYRNGEGRINPNAFLIVTWLRSNRKNLTLQGDLEACLS